MTRTLTRTAAAAAGVLALTLGACNGGSRTGGGEPVDPVAVIDGWIGAECPSSADVSAAAGIELADIEIPGLNQSTDESIKCLWGDAVSATAGTYENPMALLFAARGESATDTVFEMPTKEQIEQSGGIYVEAPEFGDNAITAANEGGGEQPATCALIISAGGAEDPRTMSVVVGNAPGSDTDALCRAAAVIARMNS